MYYHRKPTRIPQFDYSSDNFYFITICTHEKKCIFGQPQRLNIYGEIVSRALCSIVLHYEHIKVTNYVVMPNHVHAIIVIGCDGSSGKRPDMNTIIGQFKSGVSREIHKIEPDLRVWQRSYHDHIIRNEKSYQKIWEYIDNNPICWEDDCFYITDCREGSGPSLGRM